MRLVVLVDGEHHPAAVRSALGAIRDRGDDVVGALFCGGAEKVDVDRLDDAYGVPVVRGDDLPALLGRAILEWKADGVLDLTDHPVLSTEDRFRLATVALAHGVPYEGADFSLRPPRFERVVTKPCVRVIATGKRTGKTAVASALAKHAAGLGRRPVIVAVGRGGPDPPRAIEAGTPLDARALVALADEGLHAGSDYVEDALTSGVATIGCVRVGGGLAGAVVYSNVPAAARMAQERGEDLVILEGSGASVPEVEAGAGIICIPANIEPDEIRAYLGPYRLLLADLAVVTMAEQRSAAAATEAAIRGSVPELDVISVVFRPEPLAPVEGRRAFFCCTAAPEAGAVIKDHLEKQHGCEVVGVTHRLGDRSALSRDLDAAPSYDLLLTELKGAAVDVAARRALADGKDVVFVNNTLVGDGILEALERILRIADDAVGS